MNPQNIIKIAQPRRTDHYEQAGNSIVVNVLAGILSKLNRNGYFYEENNRKEQND